MQKVFCHWLYGLAEIAGVSIWLTLIVGKEHILFVNYIKHKCNLQGKEKSYMYHVLTWIFSVFEFLKKFSINEPLFLNENHVFVNKK